jgi:Methyltransferase domain
MYALRRHVAELVRSPFYRLNPREMILYTYAKWLYRRHRIESPEQMLAALGIDLADASAGYAKWQPLFDSMFSRVNAAPGQQGGISPEDGRLLYGIVRALRPEYVIETGVAAGVSNAFLNAALIENGRGQLLSIELPPECRERLQQDGVVFSWPKQGVAWAVPVEIRTKIGRRNELILGDVRQVLPILVRQLPHVDVFFHDDLHTPEHMKWEYDLVWPHLAPGAVLISDDANYGWLRFCREKRLARFLALNLQRLTVARKDSASNNGIAVTSQCDVDLTSPNRSVTATSRC